MVDKKKIKGIYGVLQGYLAQAPDIKDTIYSEDLWKQANTTIDELSQILSENFEQYKIVPTQTRHPRSDKTSTFVNASVYRTKINGLIMWLHGIYFPDEASPFGGSPSTVVSQFQQQNQSIQVQMLLDFQSKIDEKINQLEPGDKKRKFLEKVKGALTSVRDYAGLIALYVTTAQEFGLTLKELLEIFK